MTTLRFARAAQAPRLIWSMFALLVVATAARAEFQFSSFLGSSITMPSDVRTILPLRNTDLTYHGVQWYTDPLGSPPFYGFQGAYYFTNWNLPNWGIGWDYTHNKIIAHREDTVFVTGTRNGQPVADYERLDTVFQRPGDDRRFEHAHVQRLASLVHGDSFRTGTGLVDRRIFGDSRSCQADEQIFRQASVSGRRECIRAK